MNCVFDVRHEASLYGASDEDSSDDNIDNGKTLADYKSEVLNGLRENYTALIKSSLKRKNESQFEPQFETSLEPKVNTVKETIQLLVSRQEQKSCESCEKEPDFKSDSVKDEEVTNENAECYLENNIRTNKLQLCEQLFTKPEKDYALQQDEDTYELEKFKENAMIIFNHENFLVGQTRLGTALDVTALEDTFKQFRFDVTTHNDLTKEILFHKLGIFSRRNFNDYGCICVAFLTHGQDGGYLRARDVRYSEREAFACFDALANPTLAGKPIIFLIQACRGPSAAASVPPYGYEQNVELDADSIGGNYRPTESDIIIFHSSFFGRASIRVVEEGSWFIQTMCQQMKLHGSTEHVEKLFRRVRRIVALDKEHKGVKQMPAVTTTLLKKLYLKRTDDIQRETDGMHSGKLKPLVSENTEVKVKFILIAFKYIQSFIIAVLLTLLVFHQDFFVSTSILIACLIVFELIHYLSQAAYFTLKQAHHFTAFLVLFNCYEKSETLKGHSDIIISLYLFGCWYFCGTILTILICGAIQFIYEYLELL